MNDNADPQRVTLVAWENTSDPLDGGWFLLKEPDGPLVVEYLIPPEGDQQPWMPVSVWSVPLPADVYAEFSDRLNPLSPDARAKCAHENAVIRARQLARLADTYGWDTFDPHPQNLSVEEVCVRYGADSVLEAVQKDGADALSLDGLDDYEKAVRFVYAGLAVALGKASVARLVNEACARLRDTAHYNGAPDKAAMILAAALASGLNGPDEPDTPTALRGYSMLVLDAKGETAAWVVQDQDGRWYVADETHRPR